MYRYDSYDQRFIGERVAQYRDQVRRRLAGQLTEDEFRPLRLMNGLYLQLHAYMLRIAIPYGTLSSRQLRQLGHIARTWDRGFGHFTTRQNIQFHWIKLEETPDILAALAEVEMHAIQTSGNSFRNTTTDPFAGAATDEIEDPRPYCEIIRQWSTLHPEFSFLPRKFKIAVSGAADDRAAVKIHDIGLYLRRNEAGEVGFEVLVGGGLGRTPLLAQTIRPFVPKRDLLSYLEAILRIYNQYGRRDNLYKSRIKILVQSLGIERMRAEVEAEWAAMDHASLALPDEAIAEMARFFPPPDPTPAPADDDAFRAAIEAEPGFARWVEQNIAPHKVPGHAIVTISLKEPGVTPGDCTAEQMDLIADLADRYGQSEIRVTHEQNLVLPQIRRVDLPALWRALAAARLATANVALASAIICCPGLDFCGLATARSIPVAQRLAVALAPREREIGDLQIKISGCINACGHHHVGHIGLLGVDKNGEEFYQITLGGSADENAAPGRHRRPRGQQRRDRPFGRQDRRCLSQIAGKRRAPARNLRPRRQQAVQGRALCRSLGTSASSPIRGVISPTTRACPTRRASPSPMRAGSSRRNGSRRSRRRSGVRLPNDVSPTKLAGDLARLTLIVLNFPKFTDGRAYSQARLLRARLGFTGELRAEGDVLRDQLLFMRRCGFDTFVVGERALAEDWLAAFREIDVFYQPAEDHEMSVLKRRLAASRRDFTVA